jgi:hypothetical protein
MLKKHGIVEEDVEASSEQRVTDLGGKLLSRYRLTLMLNRQGGDPSIFAPRWSRVTLRNRAVPGIPPRPGVHGIQRHNISEAASL